MIHVILDQKTETSEIRRLSATDEQLIARFQTSGEAADLDEIVQRHLEKVRNLAYRVVLCHSTAEDIAQDVFVKVMHSASAYRQQASVSTWIYRITLNTAKEYLRKQSYAKKLLAGKQAASHRPHEPPDQAAMQTETEAKIQQALAQLSVKLRTAMVLTAIEHLSPKEAALIEGCSTATMHWRIHQARKQLKQLLHSYLKK